jgi:hypothetical protein
MLRLRGNVYATHTPGKGTYATRTPGRGNIYNPHARKGQHMQPARPGSSAQYTTGGELFLPNIELHGVNDIRQAEIQTSELLVSEPSVSEFELAIEKLKTHKSPGVDQIPAELIKAGDRSFSSEIHVLIISIWNKEELHEERSGMSRS